MINRFFKLIGSTCRIIIYRLKYKNVKIPIASKNRFRKNSEITVSEGGKINIESTNYFSENCSIEAIGGKINIRNNCFFNNGIKIVSMCEIEIGNNCLFGPGVLIYDHDHKFKEKNSLIREQGFKKEKVVIEDDVWIGANVVITRGVTIGKHSVIGANSVVTKNISEYTVVAGNPASLIKKI